MEKIERIGALKETKSSKVQHIQVKDHEITDKKQQLTISMISLSTSEES